MPTIEKRAHPRGETGARTSLDEVVKMIGQGRLNPDVREWAIKKLSEAGNPKGPKARAQALLAAIRREKIWVPDPINAEFMQGAHLTLGNGVKPGKFAGGDCFPKGTLLLDEKMRLRPIETIEVGERIWGYDKWTTVQAKVFKGELEVSAIHLGSPDGYNQETVFLTPDHHVYAWDMRKETPVEEHIRTRELSEQHVLTCPPNIPGFQRKYPSQGGAVINKIDLHFAKMACWDIQTEDHRVYLPDADVTVAQCDDLVIALGSATASVGIDTMVIGHSYDKQQNISHVLLGARGEDGKWYYADPSTDTAFGQSDHPTRERWLAVPSGEVACDADNCMVQNPNPMKFYPEQGEFVGVNGVQEVLIPGLLGDSTPDSFDVDAWNSLLVAQRDALKNSWDRALAAYHTLVQVRQDLGLPTLDEDSTATEQSGWNRNLQQNALDVQLSVNLMLGFMDDVLARKRKIQWDETTQDWAIELLPSDTVKLALNAQNFPQAVQVSDGQPVVATGNLGNPWIIAGAAVGAGLIAVAALWIFSQYLDRAAATVEQLSNDATVRTIANKQQECVDAGQSPKDCAGLTQALTHYSTAVIDAQTAKVNATNLPRTAAYTTAQRLGFVALGITAIVGGVYVYRLYNQGKRVVT